MPPSCNEKRDSGQNVIGQLAAPKGKLPRRGMRAVEVKGSGG